jgi:hypothetical protein
LKVPGSTLKTMSEIPRESVATESINSISTRSLEEETIVAQASALRHLQLAEASEWKRLLEKEGLLTEDEKDLIDCLLDAVRQAGLRQVWDS